MKATKVITNEERAEAVRTLEQWATQHGKERTLLVITSERQGEDGIFLAVNKSLHGQVIQVMGSIISVCADDKSGEILKIFRKAAACAQEVIDKNINLEPDDNDKPDSTMAQA